MKDLQYFRETPKPDWVIEVLNNNIGRERKPWKIHAEAKMNITGKTYCMGPAVVIVPFPKGENTVVWSKDRIIFSIDPPYLSLDKELVEVDLTVDLPARTISPSTLNYNSSTFFTATKAPKDSTSQCRLLSKEEMADHFEQAPSLKMIIEETSMMNSVACGSYDVDVKGFGDSIECSIDNKVTGERYLFKNEFFHDASEGELFYTPAPEANQQFRC